MLYATRSPRGAGGDIRTALPGSLIETIARVLLPPPSWLLTAECAPLRSDTGHLPTSIFFSLNLLIYGQPIVSSEWTEEWFFMNGRVHPYALAWEVEQHDGLESDTRSTLLYTMPALVVRDQGYQPLFASMDSFPCIPPVVSSTGPIVGPGHSLLRQDLLPGLDAAQLKYCGFVQLSTYVAPGNPDKTPFKGFHPFQVFAIFPIHANPWAILCKKMVKRRDSHFQGSIHFTYTGKVAGLLNHRVMAHPPGSDRDYVFIVVPDSWTFLDKATTTAATSALPLTTPPKRPKSSASATFQNMRAYSVATPGILPPTPPPPASTSASADPVTPPQKRPYPEPVDTPTKKPRVLQPAANPSSSADTGSSATQSFSVSASSSFASRLSVPAHLLWERTPTCAPSSPPSGVLCQSMPPHDTVRSASLPQSCHMFCTI
ncbi:hypothetical protein TOPH_02790 [Tolypocladium ophioglossoides CBS 100239]|uniref:Uncharacterized protein n=1 Tax=Tolypocladium ophioglossoides (strain CBS 100239) TaxID=1163406 RepID=A0A0L0NEU8_TOLOC|nr:hypothetical protein TOPH_02790 [Tolypocladium ophioglossoides CBS 100239]